jgi:hypothetical protein
MLTSVRIPRRDSWSRRTGVIAAQPRTRLTDVACSSVKGLYAGACAALALAALTACGMGAVPNAPPASLPGCDQTAEFAFYGHVSLADIGLGEWAGRDAHRRGEVWVTLRPVDQWGPGPPPPGVRPVLHRMWCIEYPDGSGSAGALPDGWNVPAALAAPAGDSTHADPPLRALALLAGAAVIVGVSLLAFREKRVPGSGE